MVPRVSASSAPNGSSSSSILGWMQKARAMPTRCMKQRVGIARAFCIQPKMLLLDEPFGALDALTRGTIQDELMTIVRQTQQTVFMITHDVDEAILLADRILLMSNGNESEAGYVPGGIAEVVVNPLPRDRVRASLHHLDGYYELRNHIVDFLVSRAIAHRAIHSLFFNPTQILESI